VPARLLGSLGFAASEAFAFEGDDVGVVDGAVDEGDGAGGVWKDSGPVAEWEICSETMLRDSYLRVITSKSRSAFLVSYER
jgi:hypothetical protein